MTTVGDNATVDNTKYRKLSAPVCHVTADYSKNLGSSIFLNDQVFTANTPQLKLTCRSYGNTSGNHTGETSLIRHNQITFNYVYGFHIN